MIKCKRVLMLLASAATGAILVLVLIRLGKVDLQLTLHQLHNVSCATFGGLVLSNAVMIFLSTEKWRSVDAVLRTSSDIIPSDTAAFALTSAGMALGLVLPVQVGMTAARTLGTYFYGKPIRRGMAGTLFEQGFDLLIVCFLAVASGITWLCRGGLAVWVICAAFMIAAALLSIGTLMRLIRSLAGYIASHLKGDRGIGGALTMMSHLTESGVLNSGLARRLVTLSAMRFAVVVLMATQTAVAIGAHVSFWQMGAMVPFVAIVNLLSITPGGIGINELTAVTALRAFGIPVVIAGQWSLANRVLIISSSFVLAALSLALMLAVKLNHQLRIQEGGTRC